MVAPPSFGVHPGTVTFFRLDPPSPPDLNMALDDELLLGLDSGQPMLAVRFYRWDRPSISLGRFQDPSRLLDLDRIRADAVGLVRRRTGGRGVFHPPHDAALTCAVALTPPVLTPFDKRSVFLFLHGLFGSVLDRLGMAWCLATRPSRPAQPSGPRADCFDSPSEYELVTPSGIKLLGSAQLLGPHGALLQTAIPLGPDGHRLGLYERRPRSRLPAPSPLFGIRPETFVRLFAEAVERTFARPPRTPTPEPERLRSLRSFYADPFWTLHAIPPQGAAPWPSS